ncbi:hypothetical protein HFD88_002332 [Aspergillus terreus]|nr:hypothetical protein HFD88_002332 [Aspergillus terreus]
MPKAYFDRDTITLQEGNHIGAQIGGKMIKPDGMDLVTGEVERVIIYRSPENAVELNCTQDVQFLPGEQVIFQPLDPASYAAIGMKSGKEVEFKE